MRVPFYDSVHVSSLREPVLTCVVPALAQTVTAAALGGLSSPRESPHSAERVAVWELGRERLALQEDAFPAGWTHFCVFLLLPADPLEEVAANPPQTAANSAAELLKQGAGQARCHVRTPVTGGSPRPHRHPGFPSFRAATLPRHTRREGWPRQAVNVPVTRASVDAEEGTASRCSAWGPWGDRTWAACPPAAAVRVQMRRGQRTSSGVTHAARSPGRHRAHSRLSGERPSFLVTFIVLEGF